MRSLFKALNMGQEREAGTTNNQTMVWHGIAESSGQLSLCNKLVVTDLVLVSLEFREEYDRIGKKKAKWVDDKHLFNYMSGYGTSLENRAWGRKGEEPGSWGVVVEDQGENMFKTLLDPTPEEIADVKWFTNRELLEIAHNEAAWADLQRKLANLRRYPWCEEPERQYSVLKARSV